MTVPVDRSGEVPLHTAHVVVVADGVGDEPARAGRLSSALNLPIMDVARAASADDTLVLAVCPGRLELREMGKGAAGPICVDFVHGELRHRRHSNVHAKSLLARAIGRPLAGLRVVDATAGLARDAFVLASLGCEVAAIERSPVLGALVQDALDRAMAHGGEDLRVAVERMQLTIGDARDVLARFTDEDRPDVVYLDPMYAEQGGSALSKKEMRVCRRIVGDDTDAAELLAMARRAAFRRVVVKRHRRAAPLAPDPVHRHLGRAVRYDVYRPEAMD